MDQLVLRSTSLRAAAKVVMTPARVQAAWWGLAVAGLAAAAVWWVALSAVGLTWGRDALGYVSFPVTDPYGAAVGNLDAPVAFRYAPPIAVLFLPLRVLPWSAFVLAWTGLLALALWWLAGRWSLLLIGLLPVTLEIHMGNINLLVAGAIVAGFRYPAAWSFVLLTKVTPAVGILWFAARRQWRELGIVVGASAAVVLLSALAVPGWWPAWIRMLQSDATLSPGIPLAVRAPVAAMTVVWAARGNRRWALPLACTLAMPDLALWAAYTVAIGAIPLLRGSRAPAARWLRRLALPGDAS